MSPTIFFLHIPKAAGTTLTQVIRNNYSHIYPVSWNRTDANHSSNLLASGDRTVFREFEVVAGHYPYGLHEIDNASKFHYITMLREPVARTISAYFYLRNDSPFINRNPELKSYLGDLSVGEFCQMLQPRIPNHLYTDNCQVRYLSGVGDAKPFGCLTRDDLVRAQSTLETITFGLSEEFDKSLLHFQHEFGWKSIRYTIMNAGATRKYSLMQHELSAIKKRNLYDLELYAFALDLFRRQTDYISDRRLRSQKKRNLRYQRISRMILSSKFTLRQFARKRS